MAPALALATGAAWAAPDAPPPLALPATLELVGSQGHLNAGQPQAHGVNVRGTWLVGGGDVARAEVLDETKFGSHGGIVAAGYTRVLAPDWIVAGTLALGHGGPNWANTRADVELSTKWGENGWLLSRVALFQGRFDNHRSDQGLRLAAVTYLPGSVVLEGGVIANVSQPGRVHSAMWFASATLGSEGVQYFSLRAARGTEAYQAISAGQQLVNFSSHSLGLTWRRWLGRPWGLVAQAEHYRNPSYERNTLGAGLFVQW